MMVIKDLIIKFEHSSYFRAVFQNFKQLASKRIIIITLMNKLRVGELTCEQKRLSRLKLHIFAKRFIATEFDKVKSYF